MRPSSSATPRPARLTSFGSTLYRLACRALPGWLRRRLGAHMRETFAGLQADAAARSSAALLGLWTAEIGSVLWLAVRSRWRGRRILSLNGAPLPRVHLRSGRPNPPRLHTPREKHLMDALIQDIRFALRTLAKSPGFTLVALLTIALGIGANTALFGIVDAVLLRPLPVPEPERLLDVMTTDDDPPGPDGYSAMSLPDLRDYDRRAETVTGVAGHSLFLAGLTENSTSEMIIGEIVTGNYFQVLDVPMFAGRALTPDDDRVAGAHAVAVISHDFWRTHYASDPDMLGRTLNLNGLPYEVVGIAAPGFTGAFAGISPRLWIPTMMAEQVEPAGTNDVSPSPGANRLERRGYRWLSVKARLAPGVTAAQARAELESIGTQLAEEYPDIDGDRRPVVLPAGSLRIHPALDSALSSVVGFLFVIVGLVLVVACANVANMLLARATTRGREVAIRAALGAGRGRLIRQMVTESTLLGVGGGALGLALGAWATGLLSHVHTPVISLPLDFGFDLRVFGFAFLVSLATGLAFGVVPALRASRPDLVPALRDSAPGATGGTRSWLQSGLVAAQVAVSLTLLVGAALFLLTAAAASRVDLGVDGDRIAEIGFALEMSGYSDQEAKDFYPRARERLAALPGVVDASFASGLPLNVNIHGTTVLPDGVEPRPDGSGYPVSQTVVGPHYFTTMGLAATRGRVFDEQDTADSRRVTVVNQAFVNRFWPGEDPLGKMVRANGRDWEVIGVVPNHKVTSVVGAPDPYIHFPWTQAPSSFANVLVRTAGPATPRVAELQQELLRMEPQLVFMEASSFADMAAVMTLPLRVAAWLLVSFAALAGLLASIGLYGVIAQAVARRTRELGIRKALGAGRGSVIGLVLRQSFGVTAVGTVAGLALAYLGARLFSGFLYGVSAGSPLPYLGGVGALAVIVGLSHLVPARRASRVDPMEALRQE